MISIDPAQPLLSHDGSVFVNTWLYLLSSDARGKVPKDNEGETLGCSIEFWELAPLQSSTACAAAWQHEALEGWCTEAESMRREHLKSVSLQLRNKVPSRSRISGKRDVFSK